MITGGDFQGLAILRSLRGHGVPTFVIDHEHCISRYSRDLQRFAKAPSPFHMEAYVDFLMTLAQRERLEGWVLLPINDAVVHVMATYKARLETCYRTPTPDWQITQRVYVKAQTYQLAEKHGIPAPATWYPQSEAELVGLDIPFPAVLKPSIRDHFYTKVKTKAFRVNDTDELVRVYRRMCQVIDPSEILVQELIPGGPDQLFSFTPFFKHGQSLAWVMGRRRQHPMDFGHASTYVERVEIRELKRIAETFLKAVDYYGIAEVECMQDPRTGAYKLIEVNPRFWGWHSLAIAAGVDFPYLLYRDMIGEPVAPVKVPLTELKWVRLLTDMPTVGRELVAGRMSWQSYRQSMRGRKAWAVWSQRDPLPFLAEVAMIPDLWFKRGF
ncbi:ATP-grasp domain-containing protein [Candidatus Entotheonella serta]|nr:ATP-grasp domain-containing protein [Candidatus Entotheonella serta]